MSDTFTDWEQQSGHVITAQRQRVAVEMLLAARERGLTSQELAEALAPGSVSGKSTWGGVLTVLRQRGVILALEDTRDRHHVNVLPEYRNGRPTWAGYQHGGGHCQTCTCGGN